MNFQRRFVSLAAVYAIVLLLSIVFDECEANGKKCQQYGHSCLGGHGKRSDELATGLLQQNSEIKIHDPLLNKIVILLRQLIAQRMDASQRHSLQNFDVDNQFTDE